MSDLFVMFDNVLLDMLDMDAVETKSDGGLVLVQDNKDNTSVGVVVNVGYDVGYLKVGKKVLVPTYTGTDFKRNGKSYKVIAEKNVLGVLNEDQ